LHPPSPRVPRWKLAALLAGVLACATHPPLAEDPKPPPDVRLRLSRPEDDEFVQAKPIFQVGLRGDGVTLAAARFRIVLEREGSSPQVFEQEANPKSWYLYRNVEDPGAGFRPEEPLPDGRYTWRASVRAGGAWIDSDPGRFVVDSVPPAAVGPVRLRRDPANGTILVEWDPITDDEKGAKEAEIKYRLYRYEPRPFFHGMLLNELALTLEPRWLDRDPKAVHAPTLFYIVRAVDAAWNESNVPLP
jgi:hypothetical protein